MKVILGLGNPGKEYEATRHNVGWWVLDHLADVWRFDGWRRDGDALRPFLRRPFWAPMTDLLVVCDDVALPVGTFRIRPQGSAGGSNGLKSIEATLRHTHLTPPAPD